MSGSGADPDPLDSFGTRGTRGIRGGRAAKRKREAFLRYQESQGQSRASIPVVHSGGQARPLYTPCTWEPETSTDEEPEVVEFVEHLEAPSGLLTLSRASPETILLKARPKPPSKSASSSSSITWSNPLLRPKSAAPKPSSAIPSVSPRPSSAVPSVPPKRLAVPKVGSSAVPVASPKVVASPKTPPKAVPPPRTPPKAVASPSAPPKAVASPVAPPAVASGSSTVSIRSFQPINQGRLRGVEAFSFNDSGNLQQRFLETIGTVGQEGRVVAVDWHQVTDTWRLNRREASRADQNTGALPRQVVEFYNHVREHLKRQDRLVILSHIERSERNRRFLLESVEHCQLPVDLVLITQNRTGNGGKAAVLQALLGEQNISRACILDDNLQVLSEINEHRGLNTINWLFKRDFSFF